MPFMWGTTQKKNPQAVLINGSLILTKEVQHKILGKYARHAGLGHKKSDQLR